MTKHVKIALAIGAAALVVAIYAAYTVISCSGGCPAT